jgi:uncharacterized protein (DUF302 family)
MKSFCIALFTTLLLAGSVSAADNGVITKQSAHSAKVTIDRLESILKEKGITVALRWSHSDRAKAVGIELRPTELIIFGNPKLGSHMFTSAQTAGIDLPMKALAWEDEQGQTWLSYNDPSWLAARHGISDRGEVVKKMSGALKKFTDKATGADAPSKPTGPGVE